MNYIALTVLTIVAIDWLCRMVKYAKTRNPKYKHDIDAWWK